MGHKVNPLIFRLGASNNWQYNLKEKKNWITNYLIYQLVSNQFLRYTIPYFNHDLRRNDRHSTGLVKMKGEKQLRSNNFIKKSLLFSHLLVGSVNSELKISCFFYDYRLKFRNRAPKFVRYNQLYSNSYFRWNDRWKLFFRKGIRKQSYKLFRWLRRLFPNFWIFNILTYRTNKIVKPVSELYRLNKVWLRLVKMARRHLTIKQRMFFFNVWSHLISGLIVRFRKLGYYFLSNRLYFLLITINLMNFRNKLKNSLFFIQLFRKRYFIFKAVTKSLSQNLKEMLPAVELLTIKYHAIKERRMSASLLTNLILIKLGQYYRINTIIYPLINWIKRHKNVLGYRVIVSGRLTRRERASHIIKSGRSMPLSSLRHKIDYYQDQKIMKFGMVGIKVYLFVRKKLRNSYYFFKFSI